MTTLNKLVSLLETTNKSQGIIRRLQCAYTDCDVSKTKQLIQYSVSLIEFNISDMIVKDLKHVEELLLRVLFKSGRIGLPRPKNTILNNYRICDGKYLVKQVNATNKATVQRFMLGKLKLKVLRRKYICSVQTHFTRTRRCPWRCSCTETRTGTETSRTSFRMS